MLGRAPTVKQVRPRRTPGGIRLPAHTADSLRSRLLPTPLPPLLFLSSPARGTEGETYALVKEGDPVLKHQPLTSNSGLDVSTLFAPAAGHIKAVTEENGLLRIMLAPSGEDGQQLLETAAADHSLEGADLIDRIAAAGIVGLGGSGDSCVQKLRAGLRADVELLIVNAVECDPYISADEALLREHAAAVVAGAELLRRACQAPRGLIAIARGKRDALAALRPALAGSGLELMITPDKYPAGEARQLVLAASGREVAAGHSTLDAGVLVFNAGTAHAVEQALVHGRPQTARVVTVTGRALATPKNLAVPFGTPVGHLLSLCGIDRQRHNATLIGGLMRGAVLRDESLPVDATVNCIVALDSGELPPPRAELNCIQCGRCAAACPVRLQPQRLYGFARARDHEQLRALRLGDCIDCGACATVCPSHIPLTRYFHAAAEELAQADARRAQSKHWQARFEAHNARLEGEKEGTAARHGTDREATAATAALSRDHARTEVAAAVARVRARRDAGNGGTDKGGGNRE